jgi:hypothetical protein
LLPPPPLLASANRPRSAVTDGSDASTPTGAGRARLSAQPASLPGQWTTGAPRARISFGEFHPHLLAAMLDPSPTHCQTMTLGESMPPDCAICQMPMVNPAVGGGCAHHFCHACLQHWTVRHPTCPTCRRPVWAISVDTEYATLSGAELSLGRMENRAEGVLTGHASGIRHVRVTSPAGLTLTSSPQAGCLVVKVVNGNGAHLAGIRSGDTILAINDTVVSAHQHAISFIDQRCRAGDCVVTVRPSIHNRARAYLLRRVTPNALARHRRRNSSPAAPRLARLALLTSEAVDGTDAPSPLGSPRPLAN